MMPIHVPANRFCFTVAFCSGVGLLACLSCGAAFDFIDDFFSLGVCADAGVGVGLSSTIGAGARFALTINRPTAKKRVAKRFI
jgi:hypothetical protein